jgi:NTE family protein
LVENYPKNIETLPDNIHEVQHRSRDIMFSDKTLHNIQMSKAFTYYLKFIDELYHLIEDQCDFKKKEDKANFKRIQAKYKKIIEQHGSRNKGCLLYN